jgi:hypothetical protein
VRGIFQTSFGGGDLKMLRTDGCTGAFGPRAGILRRSGAWSIGTSSRAGDSDLETLAFLLIIIDLGFLDDLQPPVASLFSFRFSFRKIHNKQQE